MTSAGRSARRPVVEEVAATLQRRILGGDYQPGDRLPPERELALELGVNRSSVREALRRLEQLRLLEIQQGSGIRVLAADEASFDLVWQLVFRDGEPDRAWIGDALELRDALLPAALRLALERASSPTRGQLAGLIRSAVAPALSDQEFLMRLRSLQLEVARASGNRVLVLLAHALGRFQFGEEMRRFALVVARERAGLFGLLARLAVMVEAGESETAERLARQLLGRSSQIVFRELDAKDP